MRGGGPVPPGPAGRYKPGRGGLIILAILPWHGQFARMIERRHQATVEGLLQRQAGDVITTGTPPGVGHGRSPPAYPDPGDVITLSVEGLGSQCQEVVAGNWRGGGCRLTPRDGGEVGRN